MSRDSSVSSENEEQTGDLLGTPCKAADIKFKSPDSKDRDGKAAGAAAVMKVEYPNMVAFVTTIHKPKPHDCAARVLICVRRKQGRSF